MAKKKPTWGGKREGAGRLPRLSKESTGRENQVSVALSPELLARLDEARGDTPRSAYLRTLLAEKLTPAG